MSRRSERERQSGFDRRLNLGCGARYREGWTNVDVLPAPGVLVHDLRNPLPFDDEAFDFVYHSHVLEHFRPADAPAFLAECRRVLRPRGVLRVVVPDLEGIARGYVAALDRHDAAEDASEDRRNATHDLYWMTLELLDQAVRERSGGRMGDLLRTFDIPNEQFIRDRCGKEVARWLDARVEKGEGVGPPPATERPLWRRAVGAARRVKTLGVRTLAERALREEDREALRVGRFRLGGEAHQWMYDRVSLAATLRDAGFDAPQRRGARESHWPGWAGEDLDAEPDGTIYKPDSLFMEATKPDVGGAARRRESGAR